MTERGFIALYRGYFDHDFFKKESLTEREAFQWLIMEACWEPKTIRIDGVRVTLQRGQIAHSIRFLSEAWGPKDWGLSRVNRFLVRLQEEGMIERNAFETPNGTVLKHQTHCLTICNYDKFQSLRNTGEEETETPRSPKPIQSKPSNHLTNNQTKNSRASEAPPADELRKVLDAERAEAVVEHRKKLRKPLTPHAARLLAGKFAATSDPNAAADAMIANGWQGFDPSWMQGRTAHRANGPPGKRSMDDAVNDWLGGNQIGTDYQDSDSRDVKLLPAAGGES